MKAQTCVRLFVWVAILGFLLSISRAGAATVTNVYDNFDSDTVGTAPPGWGVGSWPSPEGTVLVSSNLFESNPNSLQLTFTNSPDNGWLYALAVPSAVNITTNLAQPVEVKYSINLSQNDGANAMFFADSGTASSFVRVDFNNAGQIVTYTNGGNIDVLGNYNSQTWYNVTLDFIPSTHLFNINIATNGATLVNASSLPFFYNYDFYYLYFANYGSGSGNLVQTLDNVSTIINPVPEPTTIVLSVAGLLGLCAARRFFRAA